MRGAVIHGVLLAVMLVYGYRTWTRDTSIEPNVGSVVLWDKTENDLVSIEFKAAKKIVKIERKADYWWGTDTTIETKPKPKDPAAAGSAGSAGSGSAGSGSAGSAAPPVEEEEVGRKVHEFPLGETAEKLLGSYAAARALRDLGKPNDEAKKDYKLVDAKTTLTITFKDGARTFLVGGNVYGGGDKYVVDEQSGKAYVLAKDLISGLEIGESSLHLVDPRGFDAAKMEQVIVTAGDRTKTFARVTKSDPDGKQIKTWGDPDTKKSNQTAANFIDNSNNLKPTEYASNIKVADLTPIVTMTYKDDHGGLTLYKHEKPGQLGTDQELDPANPPKGEIEYLIMTEKTRVPAIVRKDTAQRAETDVETVLSDKEQPEVPMPGAGSGSGAVKSIDPKGNPFGGGPHAMPPHGAPPMVPPHGGASVTPPGPPAMRPPSPSMAPTSC